MSINRNALVALFIILGCSLYGQVQLSSPISILGFGQLVDRDHAFLSSVGGTRASFHARDQINSGNPASLAHLRTTVFSGGLYAARTNLRDGDNSSKIWSGNIGYLSLGMPLQNEINELFNREEHKLKGGLNLSLQPYSLTGFNFTDNELLRDENGVVIDTVVRNYIGDGSTYLLSLGTGWSYKNLSLGISASQLIGSYNSNRTAQFVSDHIGENYSFQTVESSRTGYRALIWNAGLMYDYVFDYKVRADGSRGAPNKYLTFGLTYQSERPLNTETDQSIVRRNITIGSIDTLTSATGIEGQGVLPATINFGASYVFKDLWRAGINYEQGFWSNFRNGQVEQTLDTKDAFKISGGFAYTPNASSITSYFDKVTYSVSGYYEKDPRVLGGEQIENYGAKIGFMLPFVGQRQVSYLNLNVGFGRLGLADGYRENYLTIGMGYSLTDNQWFIKRKYD